MMSVSFAGKKQLHKIVFPKLQGNWLVSMLDRLSVHHTRRYTLQEIKDDYEKAGLTDFEIFWDNKPVNTLYKIGMLQL
jgi:hypothetical protein